MAQIAFVVSTQRPAAALDVLNFISDGTELARLIRNRLQDSGVVLLNVTKSDSVLVPTAFDMTTSVATSPLVAQSGKHTNALIVGGAAGNLTVTGIKTSHRLVLVAKIVDAGQAYADLTSEFSITSANTINNTGGTATTSAHVVVVWA